MRGVALASSNPSAIFSSGAQKPKTHQFGGSVVRLRGVCNSSSRSCSSNLNLEFRGLRLVEESQRSSLRCNISSNRRDASGSGENENRTVLDAFFLGKALAEVINERVESTVGEVLSTIGRFQAEQQKQVQEIQEEVLERAKRAKEKAAGEAAKAQGLVVPKPTTVNSTSGTSNFASVTLSSTNNDAVNDANSSSFSGPSADERNSGPGNEDTVLGSSDDD